MNNQKKDSFIKRASQLFTGNLFAQLLIIGSAPILTRLFTPEELGILGLFMAITFVISTLTTMRYESALVVEKSYVGKLAIVTLCIILLLLSTLVYLLIVFFLYFLNITFGTLNLLGDYLLLIPFGIFCIGFYRLLTFLAIRAQELKKIGTTRFQQGFFMVASQFIFGLANSGYGGLILGQLIGLSAGIHKLLDLISFQKIFKIIKHKKSHIFLIASRYKRFFKFSLPGDLLNIGSIQLPIIILTSLFSPVISGFYVLAERVFRSPIAMMSDTVSKSILSVASEANRRGKLYKFSILFMEPLIKISLLAFVIFSYLAPEIFSIIFGNDWREAGVYASKMTPLFWSIFVFVPAIGLMTIMQLQKLELFFQSSLLIFSLSGIIVGYVLNDVRLSISLFSIAGFCIYSFFGLWTLFIAKINKKKLFYCFIKEISILGIIILVWSLSSKNILDYSNIFVIVFYSFIFIYLIYLYKTIKKQMKDLGNFADKLLSENS